MQKFITVSPNKKILKQGILFDAFKELTVHNKLFITAILST